MYYHTLKYTLTFADNTSVQLGPELGIYGVLGENETNILPVETAFFNNKDKYKIPMPVDNLKFVNASEANDVEKPKR